MNKLNSIDLEVYQQTLSKAIERKLAQQRKVNSELNALLAQCTHSDTRVEDTYVPGDYYNTALVVRNTICTTCGHIVNKLEITKGHYG